MKAVLASTFEQKSGYREIFNRHCTNPLSDDYLHQSTVRLFLNDEDRIIAGYIINAAPPIRYFDMIRGKQWLRNLDEEDCCELTCIWMDKAAVSPQQRRRVYLTAVWDAAKTGKPHVVAGSITPGVVKIQMHGFPDLVYSGPVNFPGSPDGWVYFSSRSALLARVTAAFLLESAVGLAGIDLIKARRTRRCVSPGGPSTCGN